MSPAKRKVGVRMGGGKVRGDRARQVRGLRATTPRANEDCKMSVAKLAAAIDGAEGAVELLSHVPSCQACTTSLTVLAAAGKGLKNLTAAAAGTAVERVLVRGKATGRRKLADLVYELAKACLVVGQEIDRRLYLAQRPRDQAVINGEVRGVAARLPQGERRAVGGLPRVKPSEDRALAAAESCIKILEEVEGASERQRLSWAVCLICRRQEQLAERSLREWLSEAGLTSNRVHATNNLLWSLNRQQRFNAMLDEGMAARRHFPSDWTLNFNVAVAASHCGKRDLFFEQARILRNLHKTADRFDHARQEQQMAHELPWLAEELNTPSRRIAVALGLAFGADARGAHVGA